MVTLPKSIAEWNLPGFEDVLGTELALLGNKLPLQAALAAGSYAIERPLDVMVLESHETDATIEAKVGIFYESLTPGCACAGDPTVESEQNEYAVVLVSIDKQTAEASFHLQEK